MRKIWKYELGSSTVTELEVPQGAQFIGAALQPQPEGPKLVVWAMVDPDAPRQTRRLMTVASGEPFEDALGEALRHLDTVQAMASRSSVLVVHVFEVLL